MAAQRDAWMQEDLQGHSQGASGCSQGTPGSGEKTAEFSQSTNIILKLSEAHRTYGDNCLHKRAWEKYLHLSTPEGIKLLAAADSVGHNLV